MNDAARAQIHQWLLTGEVGVSSEALARAALGEPSRYGNWNPEPADIDDLRRCLNLIALCPGARAGVEKLAGLSTEWARLAPVWDELTATAEREGLSAQRHRHPMEAPETAALLKAARQGKFKEAQS